MTDTESLAHYGVPGMKWGKRKQSDGSVKVSGRQAKAAAKAERKKSIKDMSDQELRDKINRIKMEREFDKLTAEDTSRGQAIAGNIMRTAGTMAINIGKNVAQQRIAAMLNQAIDSALK